MEGKNEKKLCSKRKPTTEELLEIIRKLPDRSEEELDEWKNEVRKKKRTKTNQKKKKQEVMIDTSILINNFRERKQKTTILERLT
jgi:hypothetical protein